MSKKIINIIAKSKFGSLLGKGDIKTECVYYLCDDYLFYYELVEKCKDKINVCLLGKDFNDMYESLKEPFLEMMLKINREQGNFDWWGGQFASKSTCATPIMLEIPFLFYAKKMMEENDGDVSFIVGGDGLAECIKNLAMSLGYSVNDYRSRLANILKIAKRLSYYIAQIVLFLCRMIKSRIVTKRYFKAVANETTAQKRIILRSWVTLGNFDKEAKFKDRNFGILPEWLQKKGYEVLISPMFFNLSGKRSEVYELLSEQDFKFIMQDNYLRASDYFKVLSSAYNVFSSEVKEAKVEGVDVVPIINEILRDQGFDLNLCELNLGALMLKRLKEKGFEIDAFYYAFECNANEKQFVIACKENYPDARLVGYQHTTFFPNQMAYHLAHDEKDCHPLPDEIICSGPIYEKLHEEARYPAEIIKSGSNLRFSSVYKNDFEPMGVDLENKKMLLLPLTYSYELAFDLFIKVKEVIKDSNDYKVFVRSHPLLSKIKLKGFLDKIGLSFEFADQGSIQQWFLKTYALISTGASITILEAVCFGVPIIRVIPDNWIYFDPFTWPDYPLAPVNTASDIKRQLDDIKPHDFRGIKDAVTEQYFTKPNEENLKVFLLNGEGNEQSCCDNTSEDGVKQISR